MLAHSQNLILPPFKLLFSLSVITKNYPKLLELVLVVVEVLLVLLFMKLLYGLTLFHALLVLLDLLQADVHLKLFPVLLSIGDNK